MGAGGRKHQDLSARDFKAPLLRVLGELSENTPDTPVKYKDTWGPLCTALGITLDQYGEGDPGKTWVQTWIGWAFRSLKQEGLGQSKGRGKWALTEAGIRALGALPDSDSPIGETEPEAEAKVEEPAVQTVGLTFNLGPGQSDEGYHSDPYIRALAVGQTKCFGCYTPRSSVCGSCPLSGPCQNLVAVRLSELAVRLDAEDKEAARKAAAPEPKVIAEPAEKPAPVAAKAEVTAWDDPGLVERLVCHVDAKCGRCGDTVPQGTEALWMRGTDNTGPGQMIHVACK